MEKKVLITGAAGYIGRHVVREFLNAGYYVIANDFGFKGVDERAEFSNISIFDSNIDVYRELNCPDILVHLAWRNGFIHNSSTHMEDLSAHFSFLKRMINSGVKNICIMGSMHEVGYWEGKIKENTPCNPLSLYGVAKNSLRQAILLYAKDKDVQIKWLRGFYIYGDDEMGSSIFAKILQKEKAGESTIPFNSGKNKYDFIEIKELSKQIMYATIQTEYEGVINVCSGKAIPLGEKVEEFIEQRGLQIKLAYGEYPDREYDSPEIMGDATIINKIMEQSYNR